MPLIALIIAGVLFRHSDSLMHIDASVYLEGLLLAPTGFMAWLFRRIPVEQ